MAETLDSFEAFIDIQLRIFREAIVPNINKCECENCRSMHAKITQIVKEERLKRELK